MFTSYKSNYHKNYKNYKNERASRSDVGYKVMLFKLEQIEKRLAEVVSEYLSKGLRIDTNATRGSQGELGKVCLTDGNFTYAIYLDNFIEYDDPEYFTGEKEGIKLVVELGDYHPNSTFWLGAKEHTLLKEERWFLLSRRYSDSKTYTDSLAELLKAKRIRASRSRGRWNDRIRGGYKRIEKYDTDLIIRIIKSKTGRKRVKAENIVEVLRYNTNDWCIKAKFGNQDVRVNVG